MLLSRLALASVCSISSGFLAVTTAKENRKVAWWLGALLLLGSMPLHLPISFFNVWADYPAWYHGVYLLSLLPLTGFGGRLAQSVLPGVTREREAAAAFIDPAGHGSGAVCGRGSQPPASASRN